MLTKFIKINGVYNIVVLAFSMLVPLSYLSRFDLEDVDKFYFLLGVVNVSAGSILTTFYNSDLPNKTSFLSKYLLMLFSSIIGIILVAAFGGFNYTLNHENLLILIFAFFRAITNVLYSNFKLNYNLRLSMIAEMVEYLALIIMYYLGDYASLEDWILVMLVLRIIVVLSCMSFLKVWQDLKLKELNFKQDIKKFGILYSGNIMANIVGYSERYILLSFGPGTLSLYTLAVKLISPLSALMGSSQNVMIFFRKSQNASQDLLDFNRIIKYASMFVVLLMLLFLRYSSWSPILYDYLGVREGMEGIYLNMVYLVAICLPMSLVISLMKRFHLAKGNLSFITLTNSLLAIVQLTIMFVLRDYLYGVSIAITVGCVLVYFLYWKKTVGWALTNVFDLIWLIAVALWLV
jgi:hypothetical protein